MRSILLPLALLLLPLTVAVAATPPAAFESRGIGGGGALFAPAWSPHAPGELFLACDMGELFHSVDTGATWAPVDFRELRANRLSQAQFTSSASHLYVLWSDFVSGGYVPYVSTDAGTTWSPLAVDPTGGGAFGLLADPTSTTRLLVSSYDTVYVSLDGGASFTPVHTDSSGGVGVYLAGAVFDGNDIHVGTNRGLLRSTDGGVSFAMEPLPGIPAGETLSSFAGAVVGGTTRFVAVTVVGSSYPGISGDSFTDYAGVYTLDLGGAWQPRGAAVVGGMPFFAAMARNDVDTMYLAGGGGGAGFHPTVWKSTDAGVSWQQVFDTVGNANIATGWCGDGGDRGWGYAEWAWGFAVSPLDSARVAISDFGFVHTTSDGGVSWSQGYVDAADANPAGASTPPRQSYRTSGLENTTSYYLAFSDADHLVAGFCDIRGIRSTDGGESWSFDSTGHDQNSMYEIVRDPTTGTLYAATSTVHDIYQSTYLRDSRLDGGGGRVLFSQDHGATWQELHDFGRPVICLALDPTTPNRLYASVIHSGTGAVHVSDDIQLGAASTWAPLAAPPRTEGHPFDVAVLDDGTLVVSYSARRTAAGAFTDSSGVFVSTNGGTSWVDRSDPAMAYWTKDVVIDPHDPTESTWYVGVWSAWGATLPGRPAPQGVGGLYRTTDRGLTWQRVFDGASRVTSCAIDPSDPDVAYVTTEASGLWFTDDLAAATPTFTAVASYPFSQPERVYWNPFDPTEIWVTSFGNGLRVGSLGVATSGCGDCTGDGLVSILDAFAPPSTRPESQPSPIPTTVAATSMARSGARPSRRPPSTSSTP